MPAVAAPLTTKSFAIRSTRPPQQKEGNKIVFGTGEDVPFNHTCELFLSQIGDTEYEYVTGLERRHIEYSKFFTDEEKDVLLKQQAEAIKKLGEALGKDRIKSTNKYFWEKESPFILNNETLSTFFNTKEPSHLLLYWKIKGGGYSDEIGPTYEAAQMFGLPFYMTEANEEAERRTESVASKVKGFSLLEELNDKRSHEDMLWLSWMLHPSNMGFTHDTPKATLYNAHYEFINGDLVKKSKKACSKQFIDAYNLLKNDKTTAIATAIVRAGEHLGMVYTDREGKLTTRKNNLILGASVEEAVETLLKPINHSELELMRDEVEEKLK